jgi:hypothetical protein
MSLQHLDDEDLKLFIKDPHGFLKEERNFNRVFDFEDAKLKERINRLQSELWTTAEYKGFKKSAT